ncbi:MAG TPA: alpha/beta hydrolase [Bryobacteraceae bacterium]|nr:alpha/beta hydrolase [Bryobacteraceae bacterium]
MPYCSLHDGIEFHFQVEGAGLPLVFSHGIGGSLDDSRELVAGLSGLQTVVFDNRAHGHTRPLGSTANLRFSQMADDVARLLDHLTISRAVVGGVSMGAGIALSFGLRHPERTRALLLNRPAWMNTPCPPNLEFAPILAELMESVGHSQAFARFEQTEYAKELRTASPQAMESLRSVVQRADGERLAAAYRHIARSTPFDSLDELSRINVPALVLGSNADPVHPFSMAEAWARALPGAQLIEIPSRYKEPEAYIDGFREAVGSFLSGLAV